MGRYEDEPFFLVTAFHEAHAPWSVGHPERYGLEKLVLPKNLADTPRTREQFATYLAEIEVWDREVGKVLYALEASGQAENTVVILTSEQRSVFPGNKWTNWNTGVHTALVVRWPGKIAAGQRTEALVQYADVLPTLVSAAGVQPESGFDGSSWTNWNTGVHTALVVRWPGKIAAGQRTEALVQYADVLPTLVSAAGVQPESGFDGSSFLPVLLRDAAMHREYVYLMHNNVPEGPSYPIRAITDSRWHYIRNLMPEKLFFEKHMMGAFRTNWFWETWLASTGPAGQAPIVSIPCGVVWSRSVYSGSLG